MRIVSLEQRERFYDRAGRETSFVSTSANGAQYLVRTQDQNVGRSLFLKRSRSEMLMLARAVELVIEAGGEDAIDGRQFIEVGANIGTTTVPALTQHAFRDAVCLEPEPANLLNLKLNLLLNGLEERATALGAAASNVPGSAELVVNPEQGGQNWIAAKPENEVGLEPGELKLEVPTVTLDGLVEEGVIELDRIGMLWMDAQSHEGHILDGARRLAEQGVPIVLEWHPKGLDRLGDRGKVERVISRNYTHFLDLRTSHGQNGQDFPLRPSGALNQFVKPFVEPGGRTFTDILILRLDEKTAKGLDVKGAVGRGDAIIQRHREPREPAKPAADATDNAAKAGEAPARLRRGKEPSERAAIRRAKRAILDRSGGDLDADALRREKHSAEAEALREAKRALRAGEKGAGTKPEDRDGKGGS